ncbi:unnamed protein product [Echinostoma caproni]|uniref:Serine/threonine-protein phosphatase 2A 55 kDa regulatory subunit B n=1 Tax=Echinostoma caproni TaxID=27848 RepID=A0A182ZZ93_9TREM|nr:unnamed protein product [Echinostoma caproni]
MEDLSEVITCARFHPAECHLLAYSTSRGLIRLCDMRVRALCDNHVLAFEDPRLTQNLGFFADIIASLSDFRFDHSGHHVLARDYLTLKVWDMRMSDRPCEVYPVHEPFRSQLCMLYENDAIFDKFLCCWSNDDRYLLTGSYGNLFRIFDRTNGTDWLYDSGDSNPAQTPNPSSAQPDVLLPKRFLSPEDPIGSCLGLTTVCVASVRSLDAFLLHSDSSSGGGGVGGSSSSSPDSCFSEGGTNEDSRSPITHDRSADSPLSAPSRKDDDDGSPPTGSKRRKQVLSAPSIRIDLQQLDCQRKLLHLAWHPRELKLATICGTQLFLIDSTRDSIPIVSLDDSKHPKWHLGPPDDFEDEDAGDATNELEWGVIPTEHPIGINVHTDSEVPPDAKVPKRPRQRSQIDSSLTDPDETTSSSVCNILSTADVFTPLDTLPGVDVMLRNGISYNNNKDIPETQSNLSSLMDQMSPNLNVPCGEDYADTE